MSYGKEKNDNKVHDITRKSSHVMTVNFLKKYFQAPFLLTMRLTMRRYIV